MRFISAYIEIFIRREKPGGKCPDTDKDVGLGSRIVLDLMVVSLVGITCEL